MSPRSLLIGGGLLVLSCALSIACTIARDAGSLTGTGSESTSGASANPSRGVGPSGADTGSDTTSVRLDLGASDVPSSECASVSQSTSIHEGPSDILVVVDQTIEHDEFESTLTNFSLLIANDDIEDVRVVMLAGYPGPQGGGVCIEEAPLGVGECPDNDDNPPMYRHIDEPIQTATLLSQVLETHDAWGPAMRDGAWKHVWVVTGSDASMAPDAFVSALETLDPGFERLTFHAMVPAAPGGDCSLLLPGAPVGSAAAYTALATSTGGVIEPLCDYNVKKLFEGLLDKIQAVALSCTYPIPTPPPGQVFERDRVNVDYDDGFGLQTIGYVGAASECTGVGNGWYYDDPVDPDEILMCPQTCARFDTLQEARVEIRFGCATVPAG